MNRLGWWVIPTFSKELIIFRQPTQSPNRLKIPTKQDTYANYWGKITLFKHSTISFEKLNHNNMLMCLVGKIIHRIFVIYHIGIFL